MPIIGSFGAGSKGGFGRGGGKPYFVQYLVVSGGGSGSNWSYGGGGGGAGGYRIIACKTYEVVGGKNYTVTIGAGGSGQASPNCAYANKGSDSVFDEITSAGGGGGGGVSFTGCTPFTCQSLAAGGSGGGGGAYFRTIFIAPTAGNGNTPPVSPSQGNNGGLGASNGPPSSDGDPSGRHGGGGGGAGAVGGNASTGSPGTGGSGSTSSISGSPITYARGGNGDGQGSPTPSSNEAANTGNGSYGTVSPLSAGNGGSGIIVIRRLTACSSTTSGTVSTCGSDTIHKFTGPGTFKA
jgi:hypothetical protein